MSLHVAVLMGGWSSEREVSLSSGAGVVKALQEKGHKVTAVDVQRDLETLMRALTPRPDVIFNALHGRGGEDGTIQGVLDFLNVPYTHSGVAAAAIAMNKSVTKLVVAREGVPVAKEVLAHRNDVLARDVLPVPYVVKPNNEGSSVGVRIIHEGSNYRILAEDSWIYGDTVLVEDYIPGRELTASVMGERTLGVTEIIANTAFYDYTAKYAPGGSTHVVPAQVPAEIATAVQDYALTAHKALGCTGVSRSDFRWNDKKPGISGLVFLEINTQPGLTPTSLLPEQAAQHGISYAELCEWMVQDALARHRKALGSKEQAA
jgi:D-alanine-D-alanine ligase